MNRTSIQQPGAIRAGGALAAAAALALTLTGCVTVNVPPKSGTDSGSASPTVPSATAAPGTPSPGKSDTDFPAGGIPADVAWPTEWLQTIADTSVGIDGAVVGIDLDYDRGAWVWEVTSRVPGTDAAAARRGLETDLDATALTRISQRDIELDRDELIDVTVDAAEAARISGETSPGTRLIELSLDEDRGRAVWDATIIDVTTLAETELKIDALSGEVLEREAD